MNYDEAKRLTAERMADPRPGDRFHEMFTFWVRVVHRDGDWVVSQDVRSGGWMPPRLDHVEEFNRRFSYEHHLGHWVLYYDSAGGTDGVPAEIVERAQWLLALAEGRRVRVARPSYDAAML